MCIISNVKINIYDKCKCILLQAHTWEPVGSTYFPYNKKREKYYKF